MVNILPMVAHTRNIGREKVRVSGVTVIGVGAADAPPQQVKNY